MPALLTTTSRRPNDRVPVRPVTPPRRGPHVAAHHDDGAGRSRRVAAGRRSSAQLRRRARPVRAGDRAHDGPARRLAPVTMATCPSKSRSSIRRPTLADGRRECQSQHLRRALVDDASGAPGGNRRSIGCRGCGRTVHGLDAPVDHRPRRLGGGEPGEHDARDGRPGRPCASWAARVGRAGQVCLELGRAVGQQSARPGRGGRAGDRTARVCGRGGWLPSTQSGQTDDVAATEMRNTANVDSTRSSRARARRGGPSVGTATSSKRTSPSTCGADQLLGVRRHGRDAGDSRGSAATEQPDLLAVRGSVEAGGAGIRDEGLMPCSPASSPDCSITVVGHRLQVGACDRLGQGEASEHLARGDAGQPRSACCSALPPRVIA